MSHRFEFVSKVIGAVTRYRGTERRHLRGQIVEIRAIVKNALLRNSPRVILSDAEIAATGGVTTLDRVVVAVVGESHEMYQVGGVVNPVDLECFHPFLRTRGTA